MSLNLSKLSQEMTSVECFENMWFNKRYIYGKIVGNEHLYPFTVHRGNNN